MYDVMKKTKNGEAVVYKTCPNKAYACTVARGENTAQYAKGIYITDAKFVNYYVKMHK